MREDHLFDPPTDEELRRREREREIARTVRREMRRVERGDGTDDIDDELREERVREAEERAEERKERIRSANIIRQIATGSVLLNKGITQYYKFLIVIGVMFFLSIFVLFMSLHTDMRHARLEDEVQHLRERCVELQRERHIVTSYSSILDELQRRGIELHTPKGTTKTIDN